MDGAIAIFFNLLLNNVDQLEIQGERPGGNDGLTQVHRAHQLDDGLRTTGFEAQLLEVRQAGGHGLVALIVEHSVPKFFNEA